MFAICISVILSVTLQQADIECEYVVVGSGAGGAVAARLAEAGKRSWFSKREATRTNSRGDPSQPVIDCPSITRRRPSIHSLPKTMP